MTQMDAINVSSRPNVEYYGGDSGRGWLFFAGTILGLTGVMRIVDGLWALSYHGALPERLEGGLLGTNLKTYGWVWIVVGLVLLLSSFAVLSRSQFARWIGIIAAGIAAVGALTWMPYYPVWSFTYIALSVLVIYGLGVYGARQPD